MDFESIVRDLSALHLNLYEFALYTPKGIKTYRFQPCGNCHNSYSVAKVFIMTALGMLWDEGKLRMDDPISRYFSLPADADPKMKDACIEHAVMHRLGYDEGFLDIDTEDTTEYPTDDYLSIVLRHPLAYAPGTHEQYSDAAYYLLSLLVSRITGEPADSFLGRRLLPPLCFHETAWSRCPQDYPIGATGLYIGAQDMVKLGALYLQDGLWEGKRLLSKEWCSLALDRGYELHPLFPDESACDLIGKWGMHGQLLAFSKSGGFAIALLGHLSRKQKEKLLDFLQGI